MELRRAISEHLTHNTRSLMLNVYYLLFSLADGDKIETTVLSLGLILSIFSSSFYDDQTT
jgi:hypothetical protein